MKHYTLLLIALLTAACGGSLPATAPTSVLAPNAVLASAGGRLHTSYEPEDRPHYSGPVVVVGVHGTTVDLRFPGNEYETRGYEVRIDKRIGLTPDYVAFLTVIVATSEPSIYLGSEGRYRATVRSLEADNGTGPWTDPYVYFSTDLGGDNGAAVPGDSGPVVGGGHDNPPSGGEGDDDDDDNPPPPPPVGDDHGGPCHIHVTSGNPHGGHDHNGDGHEDCGQGHQG